MTGRWGWVWRVLMPAMALVLLLAGCATPYARYDDSSDACHAARAPLIGMGDDFRKTVLGATAIGTGVGALGGLALGGSLKDVLIGAASGALAGAAAGYLKAKYDRGHTQGGVLALIDQDASHDQAVVSGSANAITDLIGCRDGQTRSIEAAYASHSLTRDQALAAYRGVQARMTEDNALITDLLGAADTRAANYVSARAQVLSLPEDAPQVGSTATQRLTAARRDAGAKEGDYQRLRASLDDRVRRLEQAVG